MLPEEPNRPLQDKEIREAIIDFTVNPEEDVTSMTQAELDLYMAEIGVDMQSQMEKLRSRLATAKSHREIAAAREQRLRDEERRQTQGRARNGITRASQSLALGADELRAQITRRLGTMSNSLSAIQFRNLEEATEDDLRAMLSDLDEVEEWDSDDQMNRPSGGSG